jgi:hypothetical protein
MPLASLLERIGLQPRAIATTPPAPIMTSQGSGAIPTGPVPGSKLTPKFVQEIARFAYVWAWPLVNVFNRYWTQDWVTTKTFLVGGVAPVAPVNRLGMLFDYNAPGQRYITCPSQDLIYGFGVLDLSRGLLPSGRPRLERPGAPRHQRNVPRLHPPRLHHPTRVPG